MDGLGEACTVSIIGIRCRFPLYCTQDGFCLFFAAAKNADRYSRIANYRLKKHAESDDAFLITYLVTFVMKIFHGAKRRGSILCPSVNVDSSVAVHDNFENFKIISTPAGRWVRSRLNPTARRGRNYLELSKFS